MSLRRLHYGDLADHSRLGMGRNSAAEIEAAGLERHERPFRLAAGPKLDLVQPVLEGVGRPPSQASPAVVNLATLDFAAGHIKGPRLYRSGETTRDNVVRRIAWDGAPEAARATVDAMPILKAARRVIVLTVDLRHGNALSVEGLVTLLERHGVNAEARGARSHGAAVGDTILSAAEDCHCDLVVMGSYGHSRAREHLLGGPTYSVIEHMTVPVLMSH